MGHKEGDQGESTIGAVKAVGRFYMVLKGSVESFDELLVGSLIRTCFRMDQLYKKGSCMSRRKNRKIWGGSQDLL